MSKKLKTIEAKDLETKYDYPVYIVESKKKSK
jgi:hypothetical protein